MLNNTTTRFLLNFTTENVDSCVRIGKYYTTDLNNFEYLLLKDSFDFLILVVFVRWILFTMNQILTKIFKRELLFNIPDFAGLFVIKNWISAYKDYQKKGKLDTTYFIKWNWENILVYCYDICLIVMELRIILLIQLLFI